MSKTEKIYYSDFFLSQTQSKIIEINPQKGVVFEKTVAFPEGGGQESDRGYFFSINTPEDRIPFTNVQKGDGVTLTLEGFPNIQVNTAIYHEISLDDFSRVNLTDEYIIVIDIERRASLTAYHTGIHAVLMGIEHIRPNFSKSVCGAHISPDKARLDFITEDKFTKEELTQVKQYVDNLIQNKEIVLSYTHPDHNEAWYWECNDIIYPCGGTHLTSMESLGEVKLKRKNLGKNSERIISEFVGLTLPLNQYK